MTPAEYERLDAVALAELVRRREIAPVELVDLAIAQIERLDPDIGAIVALDPEAARTVARTVRDGALAGVPFLVKDTNIDVAGFATRHGSRLYANAPSAVADSEIVRRWRAAGVIILGKTKTPEYASDFVTEPRWLGPCRNPRNLAHASGGSSGGSAAAVASGMVPAAHGTDCGGSIRVPAAACGGVGLKPSRGRNPVGPAVGEFVGGLDCEHVITRSVRDSAAFLDATAGDDPGAAYAAPAGVPSWLAALDEPLPALKIGLTTMRPDASTIDPAIAASVERAASMLAEMGHAILPFEWPDLSGAGDAAALFWELEIAALIEQEVARRGYPPADDDIEWTCRDAWERSTRRTAMDVWRARQEQNRASRAMARRFAGIDLLITPTTAAGPPLIGGFVDDDCRDFAVWSRTAYAYAPFTEIFNLTGQPALSMPIGTMQDNLPIGAQIVGHFGDEATVLRLARVLENPR